jgi:hypothetical protein
MNLSKRYSFLGHGICACMHARTCADSAFFNCAYLSADQNVGKRFQKPSKLSRAFLAT